jgi:hypothetical protein
VRRCLAREVGGAAAAPLDHCQPPSPPPPPPSPCCAAGDRGRGRQPAVPPRPLRAPDGLRQQLVGPARCLRMGVGRGGRGCSVAWRRQAARTAQGGRPADALAAGHRRCYAVDPSTFEWRNTEWQTHAHDRFIIYECQVGPREGWAALAAAAVAPLPPPAAPVWRPLRPSPQPPPLTLTPTRTPTPTHPQPAARLVHAGGHVCRRRQQAAPRGRPRLHGHPAHAHRRALGRVGLQPAPAAVAQRRLRHARRGPPRRCLPAACCCPSWALHCSAATSEHLALSSPQPCPP